MGGKAMPTNLLSALAWGYNQDAEFSSGRPRFQFPLGLPHCPSCLGLGSWNPYSPFEIIFSPSNRCSPTPPICTPILHTLTYDCPIATHEDRKTEHTNDRRWSSCCYQDNHLPEIRMATKVGWMDGYSLSLQTKCLQRCFRSWWNLVIWHCC